MGEEKIAISAIELQGLCEAGNGFEFLIHGYGGMKTEENLDVCKTYHVGKSAFNVIRACIRNKELPRDKIAAELADSGELREAAEALGGFDAVEKALNKKLEEEDKKSAKEESLRRFQEVKTPLDDVDDIFEWRDYTATIDSATHQQLHRDGFVFASYELLTGDFSSRLYHYRRRKQ